MIITTEDQHKISVSALRKERKEAIVVAHGFYNNKDTHLFRVISEMFYRNYDVFSFDFRGHGKSSGLFSWTTYEPSDLRAVIAHVKEQGYTKIGLVGFSLGAATALIESSQNQQVDSVIAVSAPYDFWQIDFHFWEPEMVKDLTLNFGPKGKGKGVRPGNPLLPKTKPIDAVAQRTHLVPILFIHGQDDWLIKPHHSDKLFEAAKDPREIARMPGVGHAEKIFDDQPDEFEGICIKWFQKTMQTDGGNTQ